MTDTSRNYKSLGYILVISLLVVALLSIFTTTPSAKKVAQTMYSFNPGNDESVDDKLKLYFEGSLFDYISLSNPERQMYTYLKFENKNTEIQVLDSSFNSVTFNYTTGPITSDRTFRLELKRGFVFDSVELKRFNFKTSGYKIVNISEVEMYFLPPTTREEWYNAN